VVPLQVWHISLLGDATLGFDAVEVDHQLLGMLKIQKFSYVGSRRLIIFSPLGIFAIDKAVEQKEGDCFRPLVPIWAIH
jgi:hypothetical protein